MKELIEKLLEEVDPDIREIMLKESTGYQMWEWLQNPALTIIEWQRMRSANS